MNTWKFIRSLRPIFIVGFLVVWNIVMSFGVHLNGGFGPFSDLRSLLVAGFGTLSLAILCFGAVYSPIIRNVVLRPDANVSEAKPGLLFIGLLGGLLTALTLLSAWKLGDPA
jgi:hypothetical protein